MVKKVDEWSERARKIQVPKNKNEKEDILATFGDELKKFDERKLNVICIGAVFCGKSSFIDSLASALRNEIHSNASGRKSKNPKSDSTTEKFQMYPMKYKNKAREMTKSKVFFGDTPGFQTSGGIQLKDVKRIIKGQVPNNYNIKEGIKTDSIKLLKDPNKKDRMHCVCFVFDISTSPDELPENLQETYQTLQGWLFDKNIPYVVILTKGDSLCGSVKDCKLNVFENKIIKERMDKLKDMFEFAQRRIFPVINYKHEEEVIPESDALLLAVLKEILKLGMEYLDESEDEDGGESDRSEE